jgi:hypothetical protein
MNNLISCARRHRIRRQCLKREGKRKSVTLSFLQVRGRISSLGKHYTCRARERYTHLLRILRVEKEKLTDDSVGGEVVNLAAKKNDAFAQEQTEGVTRLLTRHDHATGADSAHEASIHFRCVAFGGKRRARGHVRATKARGSCRALRGAGGTLDHGGTTEGHPLRHRGESEGGHRAGA